VLPVRSMRRVTVSRRSLSTKVTAVMAPMAPPAEPEAKEVSEPHCAFLSAKGPLLMLQRGTMQRESLLVEEQTREPTTPEDAAGTGVGEG
jgi:hypothetical protein